MLPQTVRNALFDSLSVKTMRYVSAVPNRKATGLTKRVYDMIREDFFKNGSLTSRSKVPELMAAIWVAGREAMLVEDKVDRTIKDAISAVLSQINDCPYCEDMLISLVHAGGEHDAAGDIFAQSEFGKADAAFRETLEWVRAIASPGTSEIPPAPFTAEQLPEVFGTLMGMSDINRFSHVVMSDSPVAAPFGLRKIKEIGLRLFGLELKVTRRRSLEHGRALSLLPPADLPSDMDWARANSRVADALARWAATVEHEAAAVITPRVRQIVVRSLDSWNGEQMPISRAWVKPDLDGLAGSERNIAKLAIILAKAPYQVDEKMAEAVLSDAGNEERFIRILAWASFMGARRFARIVANRADQALRTNLVGSSETKRLAVLAA